MSKKPLEIDMIAGSQLRDTQGEMLSVEGADISDLEAGRGRFNDNHGKGFFNSIGRVTGAKKIMKSEDCDDDRQKYYWEKVKAPFIYVKGVLYDDDEHPNAKAAAAILRNIHKTDCPLKLKASVEGGVVARGIGDPNLLARTKIHSVALTFTPANNATLVEPLSLDKTHTWTQDEILIKSVMHLAKTDVPSFRHITRRASAEKIVNNFEKVRDISKQLGLKTQLPQYTAEEVIKDAVVEKIKNNIEKINQLIKSHYESIHNDEFYDDLDLFESFELAKIDKHQLQQMMGDSPQDKDAANWARKTLKRDDLITWFARSYKKDPSIYTDNQKETLQHFMDMEHLPEIQNLRLTKEHDFNGGLDALRNAEQAGLKNLEGKGNMLKPSGKKILDVGNGMAWYSLGKGGCGDEARAMGHCGNVPSQKAGDDLLSLRKEHKFGDHVYHEPALTFINNNGYLGETKGKQNDRPAPKYHDAIVKLLTSPEAGIKMNIGGGYRPEANFSIEQLSPENKKKVLDYNPNIEFSPDKTIDAKDVPAKFKDQVVKHNAAIHLKNAAGEDPKVLAEHLAKLASSGDWENKNMARDFVRSNVFTKQHHDALMGMDKAGAANLATESRHMDDAGILDLMQRKKGVAAHLRNQLLYHHGDKLSDNSVKQLLTQVSPASYHSILRLAEKRGIDVPKEAVDKMVHKGKSNAAHVATSHPHLITKEHADALRRSENQNVRAQFASSNTPFDFKKGMEDDEDRYVRGSLGRAKNLPEDIVRKLGSDKHAWVRHQVASREDLPKDLAMKMTKDRSKYVRNQIAAYNTDPEVLKVAADNPKKGDDYHIGHFMRNKHTPSSVLHKIVDQMHQERSGFDEYEKARIAEAQANGWHGQAVAREWSPQIHYLKTVTDHPNFDSTAAEKLSNIPDLMSKLEAPNANQGSAGVAAAIKSKLVKKALTAGYGGAAAPGSRTGGSVVQSESLDDGRGGLKYIKCNGCGKEQVYMKHQVKCRECNTHFPMSDLYKFMVKSR